MGALGFARKAAVAASRSVQVSDDALQQRKDIESLECCLSNS